MMTYDDVVEMIVNNLKVKFGRNYIETCRLVKTDKKGLQIASIPTRSAIKNRLLNGEEKIQFVPPFEMNLQPISHLYKDNKEFVASM